MLNRIINLPARATLIIIRAYQKTLSPDTGVFSALFPYGFCRFHPTCSEYTYQAVQSYGMVRGVGKGMMRLLRCNPWNRGGFDPIH